MKINWSEVHKDFRYKELKGKKDYIRDMINGELNEYQIGE